MATIWLMVLSFPKPEAAIILPSAAAIVLKPVTANSRLIIIIAIQELILPISTKAIKAAEINNLSAKGYKFA